LLVGGLQPPGVADRRAERRRQQLQCQLVLGGELPGTRADDLEHTDDFRAVQQRCGDHRLDADLAAGRRVHPLVDVAVLAQQRPPLAER